MNWKFWRRKQTTQDNLQRGLRELFGWERRMEESGYRLYMAVQPPYDIPLELMRREWDAICILTRNEMPPYMNIVDLWWRAANGPIISGTKILDLSLRAPRGST